MKAALKSSVATLVVLAAAPAFAQEQPAQRTQLEEIVVTAERREARLQDVPVAVTAFSEKTLQNRQISNVVDIMTTIPNLHASNNIGQGSATTMFIRGVGETESIVTIDTPVGFYLDDVYIGRQGVNNMALFDIDRIEVLRGPQGTLYGRNTSAGAVKVVTKRPAFDTDFRGELSYGRFDAWSVKGSANAPLSDKIAFRANALVSGGGGDTFNRTRNERVNDTKFVGGRLAGRILASDSVEINLAGDYARGNQQGRYGIDVAGILRRPSGSLYTATSGTDSRNVGKNYGVNGTIDWRISDGFALKSITAYREISQNYNLDLTDQPASLYTLYTDNKSKQFSQEFQANGDFGDRLQYVAGLYFFHEKSNSFIGDYIFRSLFFRKDLEVTSKSYAAFAQANYAITDQLGLILGGRFTRDEKGIDIRQVADFTGRDFGFTPFNGIVSFTTASLRGQVIPARPGRPVKTDLNFNRFTPKAGLEFKVNPDWLLYFTYTKGYKSGGWSARVTDPREFFDFDPETINSFELGSKASVYDGRGTVNLTGFYYDYKNLFNTGTTASGSFGIATSNAKIWGIELETAWQITDTVRSFANLAWQDNKREAVTATTLVLGDRLQRTPKWQFAVGFNVDQPLTDRLNLLANVDYSVNSKHFVSPQNFPETETGPVDLFNASVGLGIDENRYEVMLGCKNCFGEEYFNQALPFGALGFVTIYPGARATWQVTLRARL
jgi:iron complex outermembrane receptor protein